MRIVAVTQNITVDGSIEFLGDWFDPTADQTGITAHLNAVQK